MTDQLALADICRRHLGQDAAIPDRAGAAADAPLVGKTRLSPRRQLALGDLALHCGELGLQRLELALQPAVFAFECDDAAALGDQI
jgi:hypothetical protein